MKSQLKNQPFLVPLCEGDFRLIVREQGTLFPMEARSRGWVKGEPVEGSSYFYHGQPILRTRRRTPFGFTSVELFSGCGGLSLGFQNAGFASVLGLDIHIPST